MATAGAFHAGGRLLLPLRHSPRGPSPSPWSHFRTHLIYSKPPPSAPLPPPVPPARPSPVGSAFGSPSRKTGAVGAGAGAGVVGWYLGLLDARPVLTKSVTAAAIFTAADLSSQVGIFSCPGSLVKCNLRPISWKQEISAITIDR